MTRGWRLAAEGRAWRQRRQASLQRLPSTPGRQGRRRYKRRALYLAARAHRPAALASARHLQRAAAPLRREDYWDLPTAVVCRLLRDELCALRRTLDLPPEAVSGLTRNGLLLAHAIRLRQVEWRLWPRFTARAIRQMIA
ncbi:MAG TPA: hypothetical protein VFU69_03910 [Ktedonobacterales bacterium]|nr:hypothetical protein [Ktedonobacterales bacterium]